MIKASVKVVTKPPDRLRPLQALFKRANGSYATVGWQSQERYPDGPLVAQVAIWNEYGTRGGGGRASVPARPFLRPAIDQAKGMLSAVRAKVLGDMLHSGITTEEALRTLAYPVQEVIRNKIKSNVGPPLAERTAARKRAAGRPAVTLIDTRRLLDELSVVVHLTDKDRKADEDRGPAEQHGGGAQAAVTRTALKAARAQARESARKRQAQRAAAKVKARALKAFGKARAAGLKKAAAKKTTRGKNIKRTTPKDPT